MAGPASSAGSQGHSSCSGTVSGGVFPADLGSGRAGLGSLLLARDLKQSEPKGSLLGRKASHTNSRCWPPSRPPSFGSPLGHEHPLIWVSFQGIAGSDGLPGDKGELVSVITLTSLLN